MNYEYEINRLNDHVEILIKTKKLKVLEKLKASYASKLEHLEKEIIKMHCNDLNELEKEFLEAKPIELKKARGRPKKNTHHPVIMPEIIKNDNVIDVIEEKKEEMTDIVKTVEEISAFVDHITYSC
jgi:hypothetical protein